MVDGLHATLDHDTPAAREGAAAPQGIHWLCATPKVRARDIGADGHPHLGLLAAAGRTAAAHVGGQRHRFPPADPRGRRGSSGARPSASITPKTGSAGPLVFVEVDHAIHANGELALNERHTIVFRGPPDTSRRGKTASKADAAEAPADFSRTLRPDPVMLFRYSALTFNAHRIHYDHPYVTQGRGLSGARRPWSADRNPAARSRGEPAIGDNALKRFSFRGVAPAYGDEPLTLEAPQDGRWSGSAAPSAAMGG